MTPSFLLQRRSLIFLLFFIVLQITACSKIEEAPTAASDKSIEAVALPSNKPNIILILGDDIGYEVPTYTGGESYETPNLDALSKQGMQFTNCYSMPMCTPSRFEMLTGKYNNRNYGGDSWGNLDLSQKTIANMLKNAGYKTCIAGKWQLNGGDASIHSFGFDTYSVTNPFKLSDGSERAEVDANPQGLSLYKNPIIYQNGNYLPTADMKGKYGEDVNREFLFKFIDSNKNKSKPFFAMWTPNLCHAPFSPTPDDPEFASWNPKLEGNRGDESFFPSMIKYFDKEVGMLMNKLSSTGISSNTVVLLVIGDNGTDDVILSQYKGKSFRGGKGYTHYRGIHVPMIAVWPGKIAAKTNTNLVDFTDFLPTIAELAKIAKPANYGVLDGQSFAPQLLGKTYTARTSVFGFFDVNRYGPDNIKPAIYALDYTYKLYEDSSTRFFNYITDMNEKKPIADNKLTAAQKKAKSALDTTIQHYMK